MTGSFFQVLLRAIGVVMAVFLIALVAIVVRGMLQARSRRGRRDER